MSTDPHTLATIGLAIQAVLMLIVFAAAFLAKMRKKFKLHCTIINIVVLVQLAAVSLLMIPSMIRHVGNGQRGPLYGTEWVHHSLGIVVILLWVLINLQSRRIVRIRIRRTTLMRTALALWVVVLVLGALLYKSLWL